MTHGACNHEIKRLENELNRLRAANAELVEALKDAQEFASTIAEAQRQGFDPKIVGLAAFEVVGQVKTTVDSALSRAEQAKPETCVWTDRECGSWETGCGWQASFEDDGPTENGYKFCFRCGKYIEVNKC